MIFISYGVQVTKVEAGHCHHHPCCLSSPNIPAHHPHPVHHSDSALTMAISKNTLFLFQHRRNALLGSAAAYAVGIATIYYAYRQQQYKDGWRGRTRVRKRITMKEISHSLGSEYFRSNNQPTQPVQRHDPIVESVVIYSDDGYQKTAAIPRPETTKLFATSSDEQSTV